jgi:hypothetical protein
MTARLRVLMNKKTSCNHLRTVFFSPMTTIESLVDRNRQWLPRALRCEWNQGRAYVHTRVWQIRTDCRLMLIETRSTYCMGLEGASWLYQLADAQQDSLENASFLYELEPAFALCHTRPLETPGYWIWAHGATESAHILHKRTLEMHNVRLPLPAPAYIVNTLYQARDTLVLASEEAEQRRFTETTEEVDDALETMAVHCERALAQGRKALLPRPESWTSRPSLVLTAKQKEKEWLWRCYHRCYGDLFQSDLAGESVFAVHEVDIATLLLFSSKSQVRCIATGIGRQDLARVILDVSGADGLTCPPCWPQQADDTENEASAHLIFAAPLNRDLAHEQNYAYQHGHRELELDVLDSGSGLVATSRGDWDGYRSDIVQTERFVATKFLLRLRASPDHSTGAWVILERYTGRWLHVFLGVAYNILPGACLVLKSRGADEPWTAPAELDLVWLESIETLRWEVMMDATPLPLELVDLVLDHIDGGFWRCHLAALAAHTLK